MNNQERQLPIPIVMTLAFLAGTPALFQHVNAQSIGPDGMYSGQSFQDGYVPRNKRYVLSGINEIGLRVCCSEKDMDASRYEKYITSELAGVKVKTISEGVARQDDKPILDCRFIFDKAKRSLNLTIEVTDMVTLKRDPTIFGRVRIWHTSSDCGYIKKSKLADVASEALALGLAGFTQDCERAQALLETLSNY